MDAQKNQNPQPTAAQPRRSSFGPTFEGLTKHRSNSMSHAAKFDDQRPAAGFFGNAWKKFTTGRDHSA
ncbi:hypothetical protein TWF694_011175 [Orbilia ellipsospora]|uniref:Conidiation-specific expression protein n=1 Tax=Orbilia ellipsospora TaxID=2528407 RepID=A0AAV9X9K6_9PEZI